MNISERLAKISFFDVTPDLSSLSASELGALRLCVEAGRALDGIYIEQAAHGNTELYRALAARSDKEGQDLLQYFRINGCPWDSFNDDEPFVEGFGPKPSFGSFYPKDFTKDEWDKWLAAATPGDKQSFESPYTVIRRDGSGLKAVPYSVAYADALGEAARCFDAAAKLLQDGSLKSFLAARADAFRSNNYFDSDVLWVDTDGSPFEATIGPYEVYFDGLLGLKAAFEASISLPDKDATAALGKFLPFVPEFDGILSQEFDFKPKGAAIPLEVVSDVYRGGDAISVPIYVAYNLPNDRRIHQLKGSKKVFSRTMMEAKFNTVAASVAERILEPSIMRYRTFSNGFLFILCHELAHGLGPTTAKEDGRDVSFEVKLRELYSCIEEAKADMLGARLLGYFNERGVIDDETLAGALISEVSWWFSSWRHSFKEAHARGHLVEYNWVKARGGVSYDSSTRRFNVDPGKAFLAMKSLSTELLNLEAAGDYDRAKAFLEEWGSVPAEIPEVVNRTKDLPSTTYPVYHLPF